MVHPSPPLYLILYCMISFKLTCSAIYLLLFYYSNEQNGRTPLTYAAQYGHENIVDYLLKARADVNGKFEGAQTMDKKISWNVSINNRKENFFNFRVERDHSYKK